MRSKRSGGPTTTLFENDYDLKEKIASGIIKRKGEKIMKGIDFRENRSGHTLLVNVLHGLIKSGRVVEKITQLLKAQALEPNKCLSTYQ
jgi:hypothetical protein